MNILSIQNNFNPVKIQTFKGDKQNDKPQNNDGDNDKKDNMRVFISPVYYQAAKNIGLKPKPINIELKGGEKYTLDIDYITAQDYLCGKDGMPDKKLVKKFAAIYQGVLQGLIDEEDLRMQNGIKLLLDKDGSKDAKHEELLRGATTYILNTSGLRRDVMQDDAFEITRILFELSKISDNKYDGFKDLDDKKNVVDYIRRINKNFTDSDVLPEISEVSRDEDGVFDPQFATRLCRILCASDFEASPLKVGEMLKDFIKKDPKNADKITDAIIEVDHSGYILNDNESFQDLIAQCFDRNKKFNEERLQVLLNAIEMVQNCWSFGNIWENIQYGTDDEWTSFSAGLIVEYFGEIKETDGKIKPEKCDLSDFLASKEQEVINRFIE